MKPLVEVAGQSTLRELMEAHLVVYNARDHDRDVPYHPYHLTMKGRAWLVELQTVQQLE